MNKDLCDGESCLFDRDSCQNCCDYWRTGLCQARGCMMRRTVGLIIFSVVVFAILISLCYFKSSFWISDRQQQVKMMSIYDEYRNQTESIAQKEAMRTMHTITKKSKDASLFGTSKDFLEIRESTICSTGDISAAYESYQPCRALKQRLK